VAGVDRLTRFHDQVRSSAEATMTLLPDLQARLDEAAAAHGDVAGAAIAVGAGRDLAEAATGLVNRDTGVAATPESLFQIGSVTKVWTATLVLQLVDEGLVDLDRPVREYLPGFAVADPAVTETVTVRQLLAHTGGFDGDVFEDTGRGDDALERYVAHLRDAAQIHPPGALFSYCNSGYSVLGALVARQRGGTWEDVLRRHVIEPLGAAYVALLAEEAVLFRVAAGHVRMPGAEHAGVVPRWQLPRSTAPAGASTCAAPRELIRFGRMFLDGGVAADGTRLLSADAVSAMCTPHVTVPGPRGRVTDRWGLGFAHYDWGGPTVIGHDGGTLGQSALWRLVPEHDFVIAMLVNGPGVPLLYDDVFRPVVEEVTGVRVPPLQAPPAEPLPVGDTSAYLGTYAGPLLSYEVEAAPDGLDITLVPGELAASMGEERQTNRFVRLDGDSFISVLPEAGRHTVLTFVQNGQYLHNGRALPRMDS
jgi:CubicO group peptidase (beta-lactamase class C family)